MQNLLINFNGTSADQLLCETKAAFATLRASETAFAALTVHGRDYVSSDAFARDAVQRDKLARQLVEIREAIYCRLCAIEDQIAERTRNRP
jgi:hypothetical protein